MRSNNKWKLAFVVCAALLLKYWKRRRQRIQGRADGKQYKDMPYAGWWYLFNLVWDGKNANRKLYEKFKNHGIVKVKGITLGDEVVLFDLRDCEYCHKNEGSSPGGAGDVLFSRQTRYYGSSGLGLGPDSHGRRMFGRGAGHNATRKLVFGTPMRSSPAVLKCAARCVDFVCRYDKIMDWIQFHQIDMFFSVMTGLSPDLVNPETKHALRSLPHDEEHAFVSGLLLSVLPWWLTIALEKAFVKAMDNMTGLGVKQLRDEFLSLPPEQRPDSFMRSLLQNGGSERDAEELMALFITAFQGNISLTLQNLIFHVSNSPDVQERLHQECVEAYKSGSPMKASMPYLHAIFKESHRLTPITDFTQVRQYGHDIILPSGWELPAGTKVMMLNKCSTRDADIVPNVDAFIPERYLGESTDSDLNKFLQRSEFGSSSRSCLGRRTAKVMLRAIVIELFRRYRLEASPRRKTFSIDTQDPSFNRIRDFPKIILTPR